MGEQAFRAQLLARPFRLLQAGESHSFEDLRRLRELNLRVLDHLDEVAPWVEEVVPADLDARRAHGRKRGFFVLDDEADVPVAVGRLSSLTRESDELVADVDEGHVSRPPAERDVEDPPVELERLVYVVDLDGDVVDPDEPRSREHKGILPVVDTYLAIASRREGRKYAARPVPDGVRLRILDAGRLAGSGQNRQPWRFYVLDNRELVERVAETVYAPSNLLGAAFVVAITVAGKGPLSFDAGRAAQNMLLAAWNEGVVGSPNGMTDLDKTAELLGLEEGERPAIILSFGYPQRERHPESRSAEEWSARANRKPLDELVRRL